MCERRAGVIAYDYCGSGPPVLFIQGVGVQGTGWRPQTEVLGERFSCLWFDNRGIGASGPADRGLSVEQMAADAVSVMDAAGWGTAHVVGHSLGGLVALQLALKARDRVRSLSLLCTFSRGQDAAPMTARMLLLGMGTRIGMRAMRRRAFLRLVMAPRALAGIDVESEGSRVAQLFGHDLADQPPVVSHQLKAMRAADPSARLRELAGVPTLVVSARHDPIAPVRAGRRLSEAIGGSRFVVVDDASHGLPITHAAVVNEMLVEHLGRAEASGARTRGPADGSIPQPQTVPEKRKSGNPD